MKHLHPWSVFEDPSEFPGHGSLSERIAAFGLDGFEMFTMVEPVPPQYILPEVTAVHLPYAIDWRCAWEGRLYEDAPEDVTYFSFGHDREEQVDTVHRMIDYAKVLNPQYGVIHAGNSDMRQVFLKEHHSDDLAIIGEFCELINRAVADFPNGEPPYRLVFENLWWEGLRLLDPAEWRVLEDRLEFDNWGILLDTGHLMNALPGAYDEESAIDSLVDVVSRYPKDMIDRIPAMHLQLSTTAAFRASLTDDTRHEGESWKDFSRRAYKRAGEIDEHRPFSSQSVHRIIDIIKPDFINHELLGSRSHDRYGDLKQQLALFGRGS
jgi:sugar phosphate isomerase/epimerase